MPDAWLVPVYRFPGSLHVRTRIIAIVRLWRSIQGGQSARLRCAEQVVVVVVAEDNGGFKEAQLSLGCRRRDAQSCGRDASIQ